MIATLLLMIVTQAEPGGRWYGELAATQRQVTILRDARAFEGRGHAGLLPGDKLRTTAGGGASFSLDEGPLVYLGESTTLEIAGGPGQWTLRVSAGEIRVTAREAGPLMIVTPAADLQLTSSIAHVGVNVAGTRLAVDQGQMLVRSRTAANRTQGTALASYYSGSQATEVGALRAGDAVLVSAEGDVKPADVRGTAAKVRTQELKEQTVTETIRKGLRDMAAAACGASPDGTGSSCTSCGSQCAPKPMQYANQSRVATGPLILPGDQQTRGGGNEPSGGALFGLTAPQWTSGATRYSLLNDTDRRAATNVMAGGLFDHATQTGQTRFVVDGKVVDISGFKK